MFCIVYVNTKGERVRMATRYTDARQAKKDLKTLLRCGRRGMDAEIEEVSEPEPPPSPQSPL